MAMKNDAKNEEAPRDPVRRWTLIVLGLIVVLFLYSLIADRLTPYTSQATVQAFVVRMAPEVAGRVIEVNVIDNQRVKGGDALFGIDPEPFAIALRAGRGQIGRRRSINRRKHRRRHLGAGAPYRRPKPNGLTYASKQTASYELVEKGVYAKARSDQATKEIEVAEAEVREAEAEVERARQELGPQGNDNPQFREALAAVEQAKLNLASDDRPSSVRWRHYQLAAYRWRIRCCGSGGANIYRYQ